MASRRREREANTGINVKRIFSNIVSINGGGGHLKRRSDKAYGVASVWRIRNVNNGEEMT